MFTEISASIINKINLLLREALIISRAADYLTFE